MTNEYPHAGALMLLRMVAAYEAVRDWDEQFITGQDPAPISGAMHRAALACASLSYKEEMAVAGERIDTEFARMGKIVEEMPYLAGEQLMGGGALLAGGVIAAGAGVPMHINQIDHSRIGTAKNEQIKEWGREVGLWPLPAEWAWNA